MSGLQKRMRRKLLTQAARMQRKETIGAPRRRTVNSWVQTTKLDMVLAVLEAKQREVSTSESDSSQEVPQQ